MQIKPSELNIPRENAVAFTGHRPDRLAWRYNERDPRCRALKKRLQSEIIRAYSEGKRYFLSGMADGIDAYAAEIVIALKKEYPDIRLVCCYPYYYPSRKTNCFASVADYSVTVCPDYIHGCMSMRNLYMVNHSSELIACFDGSSGGGTAFTIRTARERGLRVTVISV